MQNLNKKIAALSRFLSKSAERTLPFMKTLKNCTSGKMIQWTKEADEAFRRMRECLESLPTMVIPTKGETLTMYLATSKEIVSAVLMAEKGKKQIPVYFVSRTLYGAELRYPELEKLILALVYAARKLRREAKNEEVKRKEQEPKNAWKLFSDEASSSDSSGAGLMVVSPEGKEYTYALRFEFETTNNEAEYEALLAGLRIAKETKIQELIIFVDSQLVANQVKGLFEAKQPTIKQCVGPMQARNIIKEVYEGSCGMHSGPSLAFLTMGNRHSGPSANNIGRSEAANINNWKTHGKVRMGTHSMQNAPSIYVRLSPPSKWTVEVTNREIIKGMERRLGKAHQAWINELPQVLWAHRTMPKSSNGETPFSLIYGLEAVIPIEISMETKRVQDFDPKENEKRR
ncbi:reverse transcriptase domain-containing protein [Tanacetum coccineum]